MLNTFVRWIDGWMDDGWIDGWMMDGWMVGQTDGWMNGRMTKTMRLIWFWKAQSCFSFPPESRWNRRSCTALWLLMPGLYHTANLTGGDFRTI